MYHAIFSMHEIYSIYRFTEKEKKRRSSQVQATLVGSHLAHGGGHGEGILIVLFNRVNTAVL